MRRDQLTGERMRSEELTCPTRWMKATMAMAWKMEGMAFEILLRTPGIGILPH